VIIRPTELNGKQEKKGNESESLHEGIGVGAAYHS
jgi:hypothetical protein